MKKHTYKTLAKQAISEDWGARRTFSECEAAGMDYEELQHEINDQLGDNTRQYKGIVIEHPFLAR